MEASTFYRVRGLGSGDLVNRLIKWVSEVTFVGFHGL